MSPESVASAVPDAPTHKCGRCRVEFARDATPDHANDDHWWLCPPCRARLLGDATKVDARWA
jgi:hypothetical protein